MYESDEMELLEPAIDRVHGWIEVVVPVVMMVAGVFWVVLGVRIAGQFLFGW